MRLSTINGITSSLSIATAVLNGFSLSSIPNWRAKISYVELSNTTVDDDLLVMHDKPESSSNFCKKKVVRSGY